LHLIFSRFGKILSCEVIRDKRTGDSLQYAFIEFEHQKDLSLSYRTVGEQQQTPNELANEGGLVAYLLWK